MFIREVQFYEIQNEIIPEVSEFLVNFEVISILLSRKFLLVIVKQVFLTTSQVEIQLTYQFSFNHQGFYQ